MPGKEGPSDLACAGFHAREDAEMPRRASFSPCSSARAEAVGRVLYDTLEFADLHFEPRRCSAYRLFVASSFRPDKSNMDCAGMLPGENTMLVMTVGVRIDLDGPIAEDMLHTILRGSVVQLIVGLKEYVHLPLALLYPTSGVSVSPLVVQATQVAAGRGPRGGAPEPVEHEHELGLGPYRSWQERAVELAGPSLLPTVHGAVEVEAGPGELDALGRPSWLRGGFCRFAFIVPQIEIRARENFYAMWELAPVAQQVLQNAKDNGLLKGELVVYLGGVYRRDLL
jgi:hypothetical protein